MICDECVFHKAIEERGQDVCCRCGDVVEGIKACINADLGGACINKMTRTDVIRLSAELEQKKRERDRARKLLGVVQRVIAGMLREGGTDAAEV